MISCMILSDKMINYTAKLKSLLFLVYNKYNDPNN